MEETLGEVQKPKQGIYLVQACWWIFTSLSILLFLVAVPSYFQILNKVCITANCLALQLNLGRAIILELAGINFQFYARLIVAIQIVVYLANLWIGVFIYSRKSKDWLAIFVSLMLITSIQADLYRILFLNYPQLSLLARGLGTINSILLVVFFYIFPTGSFRPRWTIILAVFWVLTVFANSAFPVLLLSSPGEPSDYAVLYLFILVASSLFVLAYRYRRVFNPTQKIQTKWVVLGVGLTWGGEVFLEIIRRFIPIFEQNALMFLSWNVISLVWTLILPVSILIAVLSAALLDIDVLLRRTLAYSALTVTLIVIYFGSVILLQALFEYATGQKSSFISILSTLAIAAMFTPLRKRIQSDIDRVFFRKDYNAVQAVDSFSSMVREDVDLEEVSTQLVGILRETLQPEFLSFWLTRVSPDKDLRDENQLR